MCQLWMLLCPVLSFYFFRWWYFGIVACPGNIYLHCNIQLFFAFFSGGGGGGGGGGGQKGGGSSLKSFRPGNPFGGIFADSADPAQTPQNAASGQGLHCVSTGTSVENTDKMKPLKLQMDPLK